MHHTLANRVAAAADATQVDLTPVPDQVVNVSNAHWFPSRDYDLWQAWFGSTGLNFVTINTATIRTVAPIYVRPLNGALFPSTVTPVADWSKNPVKVRKLEEFQLLAMQTTGGAVNINGAMHWMADFQEAPKGQPFTMIGTASTTLVAGAWTQLSMTWGSVLPAGRYAIVGMEYVGATAIAARCNLENQVPRPGCFGTPTALSNTLQVNQKGALGIWGYFDNYRMPIIECFANAADTAQTIYLDFVRVN